MTIQKFSVFVVACFGMFLAGAAHVQAQPANDDCNNPQPIGDVTDLPFDTSSATFDGPGLYMTSPNIWYCYTASCTGRATVSLCGSSYDTMLAAYEGCTCDPIGTMVGCNDDYCDYQSETMFATTEGSEYLIEVGGYGDSNGPGLLSISCRTAVDRAAFSIERWPGDDVGVPGSAIEGAWGTGTLPNTIYKSEGTGTNVVGLSGRDTGTSGTRDYGGTRRGQDVDAVHFGPMVDPCTIQAYLFSLDFYSGDEDIPYPPGSGTARAPGTGTAPSNVYASLANGTNNNAFPAADLGIVHHQEGNTDAFTLLGFVDSNSEPNSYPVYLSLDLRYQTEIDFDEDGVNDVNVNGADLLYSTGDGTFDIYLSAAELGLNNYDNLDALVGLNDGSWLFSVDWGESYGNPGLPGTAVANSNGSCRTPAIIFRSFGDGTNTLWLSSEAFGIPAGPKCIGLSEYDYYGPNLDALGAGKLCMFTLIGDLNDNCKVDLVDFAMIAGNWLIDCTEDPNNPACIPK